jgi:hypothetical protein
MNVQPLTVPERLNANGGTVASITCKEQTFYSEAFRDAGEVNLYDSNGDIRATALFDEPNETLQLTIDNTTPCTPSQCSDTYHAHTGKMAQDLAEDVGLLLARLVSHLTPRATIATIAPDVLALLHKAGLSDEAIIDDMTYTATCGALASQAEMLALNKLACQPQLSPVEKNQLTALRKKITGH